MVTWWLLLASALAAQVQLRVEPPELLIGQTGTATVTILSASRADIHPATDRPAEVPTSDGLIIAFSGQASQFTNRNGRITQVNQFQYRVTAVEEGTWSVGPVRIPMTDGSTLQAEAIRVRVRPRDETAARSEVEAHASFSRDEVWEGELVLYRFGLRTTLPDVKVEWNYPDFDGLRLTQEGRPVRTEYVVDDPDGAITVHEGVIPLIATGTGARPQGRSVAQVQIPVGRSLPFGIRRMRTEPWPTEAATLTVKPLPPAPPGFTGLVGDFEVTSRFDADRATVGQSLPWTIAIQGDGALEGFSLPAYPAPNASVYEGDERIDAHIEGGRYVSSASFRRVVVPTQEGSLALPPLELITFSPTRGAYVTHTLELPTLPVAPGREGGGEITSFGREGAPLVDGADDAPGAVPRSIVAQGSATSWAPGSWLPWLLALVALPGLGVLASDLSAAGIEAWRRSQAARVAPLRALDRLEALAAGDDARWALLDAALREAGSEATGEDAVLADLWARLQRLRFAPGTHDPDLESEIRAALQARRPS